MSIVAEVSRSAGAVQRAFAAIAPLLRYPDAMTDEHVAAAFCAWADAGTAARGCATTAVRATEHLGRFALEIKALDLRERQALYTSTFDLAPSCSPYLGAHRFGDESPERARLMVGLRMRYGSERAAELPDHAAEVFAFARNFYEEEWNDLRELVVKPALDAMSAILSPTANPYRHLLAAARALCEPAEGSV